MTIDRPIALLAVGQTLAWAGIYYVFPAMLVRWEADPGWTKAELTLAVTLAVFASALAAPLAGRVIDRGFGAAQIGLSAAVAGLALAGLSRADALWQFHALWLVIGTCQAGCLYDPCFAIVVRARGPLARQAITRITLVAGFAGTVSFPAFHLLSEALGWRPALALAGAFVALVVAPALWAGARGLGPPAAAPPRARPERRFVRRPAFWLLGAGFALAGLAHGAVLNHLLPLLAERGVSAGAAVLAASTIGPMQVVGRLAMVATERRVSSHAFAVAAFLAIAGSIAVLSLAGAALPLVFAFVLLFGGAYGTVSILRPVIARDVLGGEGFGAKSGGLSLLYLAAAGASAYAGALLWNAGGYELMLAVMGGCALAGAATYLAARRAARAEGPDGEG